MNIIFGNWRLRRHDDLNWVLEHWHEGKPTGRHGGSEAKWRSCNRYYQYNGIPTALMFAADWELRNGDPDRSLEYHDAAAELIAAFSTFKSDVLASVSDAGRAIGNRLD